MPSSRSCAILGSDPPILFRPAPPAGITCWGCEPSMTSITFLTNRLFTRFTQEVAGVCWVRTIHIDCQQETWQLLVTTALACNCSICGLQIFGNHTNLQHIVQQQLLFVWFIYLLQIFRNHTNSNADLPPCTACAQVHSLYHLTSPTTVQKYSLYRHHVSPREPDHQ